ncbi:MAG: helix-hairpin-helix domain-containing protein [Rhodothermales bacterium]
MRGFALLLFLLGCTASIGWAQATDTLSVEDDVETLLEGAEDELADPEELADLLESLRANPLNINAATLNDFAAIPLLSPLLAQRIIAYRTAQGRFQSIPELQNVEGIDSDLFFALRPFLRIGEMLEAERARPSLYPQAPSFSQIARDLRYEVMQRYTRRLDLGRGYDDDTTRTTYLGSPERLYTRLRITARRYVSLNVTLDKDPGETYRWNPANEQFAYDFASAHLMIGSRGRLKTLILGDYIVTAGQGLTMWRGTGFGKGASTTTPMVRRGKGPTPYGSSDENRFLRGAAASVYVTPALVASAFTSQRQLDASFTEIRTDSTDREFVFSSFNETGLHRTTTELARRDALQESLVGGQLEYTGAALTLGVVGYGSRFASPVQTGTQAYQRFGFAGDEASGVGLYGQYFLPTALFFGEVSRVQSGAVAGIGGAQLDLSRAVDLTILGRSYPRDYASLHGFGFGERNGVTQNERGVYVGVRITPRRSWTIHAYRDQYRFPWARFGTLYPSRGWDALVRVEHRPRRWLLWYAQGRTETRESGADVERQGRTFESLRESTRQSFRLHGDYQFSRRLRVRARTEWSRFAEQGVTNTGILLYQEARFTPVSALRIDARLAFFDTDDFDARLYAYEYDLLYTFSVPAFSGRGQRAYVLIRWQPHDALQLEAKYGVTRFEDRETVGSGLDEVVGNHLREARLQLRWRM